MMEKDRDKMAERVITLTLEILFQITGEDYTVVKKTTSGHYQAPECEGWGRTLSPIPGPPPHSLIHEEINEQKILELTNKMVELLTGEVPIRCQDVAVYFSMEEWEYLEGHKDQYKDIVMMEDQQPLTSPVRSRKRTKPQRCPRPLLPPDCSEGNHNVPQDYQFMNQNINAPDIIVKEETDVMGDEPYTEDISTGDRPDYYTRSSEGLLISSGFKEDSYDEHIISPDIASTLHRKYLSLSDTSQTVRQNDCQSSDGEYDIVPTGEKPFSCSECDKCFTQKITLITHMRTHTGEKPFICSECGKCFNQKSALVAHQRIHTGAKPFTCLECGKHYNVKSNLVTHQRTHTGEKPFSCSECGKCFAIKKTLIHHQRAHTGERPFSCSECGKRFKVKSDLITHERNHTGVKPFSCLECGKGFRMKVDLVTHQRNHTGERPFSCSECGKYYRAKSKLIAHQRSHTGEKPFLCSECGKCYRVKASLVTHQRTHTGEKPFSCLECGKSFTWKSNLFDHQKIHSGERPYSCSECGKCFTHKKHLLKHQKIHTGN